MRSGLIPLVVFCLISLGNNANAQSTQATTDAMATAPTEVGTTTMPPGQYTVIEQNTGKKYSLMVTTKGTMICGPATAAASATPTTAPTSSTASSSAVKGLAEKEVKRYIENKSMSQIQNLIK